jgi:hypothetical protein
MKDWSTKLTFDDLSEGGCSGLRRRLRAMQKGRTYKNGRPADDILYKYDIEGAMCELAAARILDLPWEETVELDRVKGDVAGMQVRSTDREDGCLILYKDDDPEDIFLLVTHSIPVFTLRGWLMGHEGKLEQFWDTKRTGRPAYFVPQSVIYSMDRL